jgi:anti-sigma28 factor (negative regulator of flagellin synthesis)
MDINRITNGGLPLEPLKSKKVQEESVEGSSREDRVELSDEAIHLFSASEGKRLEDIRQKIDSGFYLQKEVSEKVVDAMLRDLKLI